ncbi:MAG: hypothetical protein WCJ30_06215 [Deltaproteobacteria bacterium]
MESRKIDPQTEQWTFPRAELTVCTPRVGVLRTMVSGHATSDLGTVLIEQFEAAIARFGSVVVFDDWEAAIGYDSDVRLRLTEWTRKRQPALPEIHILVGSKIVAMGLSVAAMVVRHGLKVHPDRASFELAYTKATRGPAAR